MLGRPGSAGPVGTTRLSGAETGNDPTSAFLRVAVVGPVHPGAGRLASHTVRLAHQLAEAGHDVTLVSWSPEPSGQQTPPAGVVPFPRTVRSLAWNRPDTWLRTGRRLRAYDTVVVVHTGAAMVPQHLALLRAAGTGHADAGGAATRPRGVLVCDRLPAHPGATTRSLVASVLRSVDGVLVHRHEDAELAARLGAPRVYAVPEPESVSLPSVAPGETEVHLDPFTLLGMSEDHGAADLSAPWAAYLGAIETLAAPHVAAADLAGTTDGTDGVDGADGTDGVDVYGADSVGDRDAAATRTGRDRRRRPGPAAVAASALTGATRLVEGATGALTGARRRVDLSRADLPDWLYGTDVLDDGFQADEARDEAHRLGLARSRDPIGAWAALGALAAVIRVADDGRHAAVVVDESGSSSPLTRWARACGFAPVDLGLTTQEAGYDVLEVDAGSLDVVARVHPGGCDASDVDEALSQAAWALRPGGLLVLTLPLGRPGPDGALGPADVRAVVARAHDHGFVLVGDLDGDVGHRMRSASVVAGETAARVPGAAYGLVRLTLRRR